MYVMKDCLPACLYTAYNSAATDTDIETVKAQFDTNLCGVMRMVCDPPHPLPSSLQLAARGKIVNVGASLA